jgi:hypothetical protein
MATLTPFADADFTATFAAPLRARTAFTLAAAFD